MNTQAINQFLQKVTEDPQLQEELAKALEAENERQAATDLAVKHGYQFTPDVCTPLFAVTGAAAGTAQLGIKKPVQ